MVAKRSNPEPEPPPSAAPIKSQQQSCAGELLQSEENFRMLVEGVKDCAILMLDPGGRIVSWNAGAERIKDYRADEIIGKHFSCFYTPEDLRDDKPGQELKDAAAKGSVEVEGWRLRKDGSLFWANMSITALRDETGRLRGFAMVTRDITEGRRAVEALKQTAAELSRSNSDLEQFARVASHDLQEPLRMMISATQLLARDYKEKLDSEAVEYMNLAVEGAKRMQSLINELLEYSRLGARQKPFALVDCQTAYRAAIDNLTVAIQESGAVLTNDPLPSVMGDGVQLIQLFQNLLANAIKFRGQTRPRIHVSAGQNGKEWQISVNDNGIGIDPKSFGRLFVLFQRLHARDAYPGTGIGLAICKKIVEQHGGRIWVESAPGAGATFYFTIPLVGSRSVPAATSTPASGARA